MVLAKARYLECLFRVIKITTEKTHCKPLARTLCRPFTNIASADLQDVPKGFDGWEPVDDVYRIDRYPPKIRHISECLDDLRAQDKWAYCRKPEIYSDRTVNLSLLLDLTIPLKKKQVEPFIGMAAIPHKFKASNKVICFAEGDQVIEAMNCDAHMIGDEALINQILNDEFTDYDYIVASPSMMAGLLPLKKKLRKTFPSSKRGSVGVDMKKMLALYLNGIAYKVQTKIPHVNVAVGKLSLSNTQIEENVKSLIEAVCTHKPPAAGPLIRKATVSAFLLDGHQFEYESYVPGSCEEEDK
ncbi:large ribosomal subunit protein uL1-like [Antedon mediterranea]|uniref:large ribosomal subunit protein uL1-like n=1 Tax=Antedon mediterranea TaxID=105859 RepID=UPI003AF86FCB